VKLAPLALESDVEPGGVTTGAAGVETVDSPGAADWKTDPNTEHLRYTNQYRRAVARVPVPPVSLM